MPALAHVLHTRIHTILLTVTFFLMGCLSCPASAWAQQSNPADGRITVSPDWGIGGDYGTWRVTYRVGPQGIAPGGGIRVQLPDVWHAGDRNSAHPLQASRPSEDHYISARSSRDDVKLTTIVEGERNQYLIKHDKEGLDGRRERYIFVVRVTLTEGQLQDGDSLTVIYGDTSEGSRGMKAGIKATPPRPLLAAVDTDGNGDYHLLEQNPAMEIRSGPPSRLLLTGPSTLEVNQPATLKVAVIDHHANPVEQLDGTLRLEVLQGHLDLPSTVPLQSDNGWSTVTFTPTKSGIIRLKGTIRNGLMEARSNPMQVHQNAPDRHIYWGDLHSHSTYSWDGVGTQPYQYARYVSHLDFYALTDHSIPPSNGFTQGLYKHAWHEYTEKVEQHHTPGSFVTIHAYEASFQDPYGHHNVFFRGQPGPLLAPANVTLPEMWEQLEAGEALTIPHHTGKFPSPVHWEPHDPELRRNFEIYSAHGLSEAFDPTHPLAFEQSNFTSPSSSQHAPQYAQDAWQAGLKVSTIASSDDHRAQPGKPHWGLAAVKSDKLTRESVFDALYTRHTYGTTGARILLDFSVNGQPMGEQLVTNEPPVLEVEVHGTRSIDHVDILRYTPLHGSFEVIHTIEPDGWDVRWSMIDRSFRDRAIYYVRVRQKGQIRGRTSMAWSSPIWVLSEE